MSIDPIIDQSDEAKVRAVHSTWLQAVNAGDLTCLLTLITDDVVFLNPGRDPIGREGFSATFVSAHERNQICCSSELEEVVVVGEVAYTRSRDRLSVTARGSTTQKQFAGDRMTVYRKQADGRWLLARDAHTLTPVNA